MIAIINQLLEIVSDNTSLMTMNKNVVLKLTHLRKQRPICRGLWRNDSSSCEKNLKGYRNSSYYIISSISTSTLLKMRVARVLRGMKCTD